MALQLQTTPPGDRLKVREGAIRPYLRAVRAHIVLFTIIVLATVAGGIAYLSVRSPNYEATAQILITPLPQDDTTFRGLSLLRDSGDPARTAQTAAALIDTQAAAELTAERLGQGFTAKKVLDRTDVKPLGDSDVLAVTARADDADEAARIANQFTASALEVRQRTLRTEVKAAIAQANVQLNATPRRSPVAAEIAGRLFRLRQLSAEGDTTLSESQRAIAPSAPAGPSAPLVVMLSLLAGLTIGAGTALVLELIDWRIRDEDDLVRLGSPQALARLPKLSRQEARVAASSPLAVPPPVREGFRTLQIQLDWKGAGHRSVMITSASTGDGKTSSAINLAAEAAGAGYRTLLVDLDLRKPSLGRQLGLNVADGGVLSLMDSQSTLSEAIVSAPQLPGVQLLLAPANAFALAEGLGQTASRWLPGILAQAKELADYVIIDTAPLGEVSDALRVATQVDEILLVARLGHTRKDGFQTMLELLDHASCTPAGLVLIGSGAAAGTYGYYGQPRVGPGAAGVGAQGWPGYRPANSAGRTNARPAPGSGVGEPAAEAAREPRRD